MKAEDRKTSILRCAKTLFSESGYHNTQISDIVKLAKIARGTIYQYFKNKDDVFITLLKGFFEQWNKVLVERDNTLDLTSISPDDFFHHRVKTTLNFFAADHELCNIVLRMGVGLHEDLENVVKSLETDIQKIIRNEILLGQKIFIINEAHDVDLVSNVLAGAILRTSYYYFVQERNTENSKSVDEIAAGITKMFAPGLFISEKIL